MENLNANRWENKNEKEKKKFWIQETPMTKLISRILLTFLEIFF